jgi:hypothetical protein
MSDESKIYCSLRKKVVYLKVCANLQSCFDEICRKLVPFLFVFLLTFYKIVKPVIVEQENYCHMQDPVSSTYCDGKRLQPISLF